MSSSSSSLLLSSSDEGWFQKHRTYIVGGLAVCVVLGIIVWFSVRKKVEMYAPAPTSFLVRDTTRTLLASDLDKFGQQFNLTNLEACGVDSPAELLEKWSDSAADFTPVERKRLQDAALVADYQIHKLVPDPMAAQLNTIGWRFAKTLHPYYLDGLPHTRLDAIFVTDKILGTMSNEALAALLVHEKVHLWQRKYPSEMVGWIERQGYKRVKRVSDDGLQRYNPDVDEWLYENEKGDLLGVRYNSTAPRSLYDVHGYSKELEHPHEIMAYTIQTQLFPESN